MIYRHDGKQWQIEESCSLDGVTLVLGLVPLVLFLLAILAVVL